MFKSLKKWIGTAALVGASLLPTSGHADNLRIYNSTTASVINTRSMYQKHISGSTDGYDSNDRALQGNGDIITKNQWLDVSTSPYGTNLYIDARDVNSESPFVSKLAAGSKNGTSLTCDNRLNFAFVLGSSDSTRHYTAKINCSGNWTPNGQPFTTDVNIRDVVDAGGYLNLPGIANCPSGTVYGTVDVSPAFNKLVSTSTGSGANSPNGTQILNYNSTNTVSLNANEGNFVDKYTVITTGNTGGVSVVTTDIPGQDVASTNVTILGLKGSNSVSAVYGRKQFPVNVATSGTGNSSWTNGTSFWGDSTNVNFNAGAHSGLSAILVNGVVNKTFNPATNSCNFITEPVTNAQTITGVFDLEKFLVTAAAGRNGSVGQTQAEVAYGGSTSVVYTADAGFKTGKIYVDGNLVSSGGNLEERVSVNNVTGNRNVTGDFKAVLLADGTPEWFRIQNGLAAGDLSKQDTDGDRVSDGDEFIGGTDPTNATSQNSQFRVDGIDCANGTVQITYFGTSRGRVYGAEFKPTLTNMGWQVLTNKMTGNGGDRSLTLTFPNGNTGFFQGTISTNEQASELIEYTINTELGGTGDGSISPRRARVIDGESTNIVVRAADADRSIVEVRKNNVVIPEAAGQVVQIVPFENMTVNNQTVTAVVNDLYDSHGIPYWRYTGSGLKHPGEVVTAEMEGDVDDPDAVGDPDHDGFVNWIELQAGRDPLDPESYPGSKIN